MVRCHIVAVLETVLSQVVCHSFIQSSSFVIIISFERSRYSLKKRRVNSKFPANHKTGEIRDGVTVIDCILQYRVAIDDGDRIERHSTLTLTYSIVGSFRR